MNTHGQKEKRWIPPPCLMPAECEKEADGCLHSYTHTRARKHRPQLTLLYMIELKRMLQYPQTSESFFGEQVPLSKSPPSKHQGDLFFPDFLIVKSLTQETGNSFSRGIESLNPLPGSVILLRMRGAHKYTYDLNGIYISDVRLSPLYFIHSTCCVVSLHKTPKKLTGWLICVKIPALFKSNGAAKRSTAHNH